MLTIRDKKEATAALKEKGWIPFSELKESFTRDNYPELFALATNLIDDSEHSSTFKVPDLQGEFIQGEKTTEE